jgi:hypothetical protein
VAHVDRRSDLLAAGLTDDDIQRRRRKELVSIRAGRYVERSTLATLTPFSRHRLLAVTAAADLSDDAVLSHVSAACLLGLPLWGLDLRTVQITRPGSGGGHRRRSLHTRYARLADDQIVEVGGFRVTSAARTLVDLGPKRCLRVGGGERGRSASARPGDRRAIDPGVQPRRGHSRRRPSATGDRIRRWPLRERG